ncbi:hypothetical protein ABIB40_000455 [Pedobacter sp. UYP30]|uniref:hypothetical protein n=1 Tax=Pedobacter sp. UYP30 TaxID=1756400 RepID=UPI0033911CEB
MLKFKIFGLAVLLFCSVQGAFAQFNELKYTAGINVGPNRSYTDVKKGGWGHTFAVDFNYYPLRYLTVGLEGQTGLIQGGNINTDLYNRQFANRYASLAITGKLMVGKLFKVESSEFLYAMRGLYAGVGAGIIKNHMIDIVRYRPSFSDDPGYGPFPGKDDSYNVVLPFNLGINFYIAESGFVSNFIINVNAQSNITIGEGLDGYDDPPNKFENKKQDIYNVYSVGIKYIIGRYRYY